MLPGPRRLRGNGGEDENNTVRYRVKRLVSIRKYQLNPVLAIYIQLPGSVPRDAVRHISYQRRTALAQEKPDPKLVIDTTWPDSSRPARAASSSSIGIEADEQLP